MWGIISTTFLGLYCLMCYYISRRGWTALGKPTSRLYRYTYWLFAALLIVSFPASEILEDLLPPAGQMFFTIWGGYSMIAVVYFFMIIVIIDLVILLNRRIAFVPALVREHQKTPITLGVLVFITVLATLVYGGWNAQNPIVTDYKVTVNKQAGSLKQLRIAMVSDIHYGEIIDIERVKKLVDITNELQPDILLIAGDILDGRTEPEKIRKLTVVLSSIKTKYGIFAVPGNHDRSLRGDKLVLNYFEEAGINMLIDTQVKVADNFYIIGRDDPGWNARARKDLQELLKGVDESLPLIVIDHQPTDLKNAQENQVDLQVSGHTHRGQVFPSSLITGQIYELDWGLLKRDNYHVIVSSGFGTWGPPLRIGNNPEVVNITMNFK